MKTNCYDLAVHSFVGPFDGLLKAHNPMQRQMLLKMIRSDDHPCDKVHRKNNNRTAQSLYTNAKQMSNKTRTNAEQKSLKLVACRAHDEQRSY